MKLGRKLSNMSILLMQHITQDQFRYLDIIQILLRVVGIILIVFTAVRANAQNHIYENFGVDDGLPSSEIYDIHQDIEGYIWFATDKGLSKYNGNEFENFNTTDGLPGNVVLKFYPQKNGQIWCYTLHSQSLFYFDEKFDGFKQYEHNDVLHKLLDNNSIVKSVYLDKEGHLHLGGYCIDGEKIILKNGDVKELYTSRNVFRDSLHLRKVVLKPLSDSVTSIFYCTTTDNNIIRNNMFKGQPHSSRMSVKWLVENEIAIFMNSIEINLVFRNQENVSVKSKFLPLGIRAIDENRFFIGYQFGGAKIVDNEGNRIREYLDGQSVTSFLIDHEGGYWFTTLSSGAYYIKNPSITTFNSIKNKPSEVNSLVKIDNELLIGYSNGVISKMAKNREVVEISNPKIAAHSIVEYDSLQDKTYLYSGYDLLESQEGSMLKRYLLKLSEPVNNAFFASDQKGFFEFTEKNIPTLRLCPYRVHDVCIWNGDTIVATPVGIFKFQNNECHPLSKQSYLFDYRSDDIDVNDKNNTLYVATQGVGIIIHKENRTFNLTKKNGLNSDIINEVHIENDSTLWACTNRGINRIIWSEQGINIISLNTNDGLLSNEVNDIEIINDTVWVGTMQGLCSFPKNQLNPKKIAVPDLILKDVMVNNISQTTFRKSNIAHNKNKIDIVLEGISYAHNDAIQYQYRLNKNQFWTTTQNKIIHFPSLSSGNYEFEARMCIDDLNCSKNKVKYAFTIQAPFWKTWWFASLCLGFFGLLIYIFFKIRVLTYNKDVLRELIRLIIKRLKKDEMYFSFRENGNHVRIKTENILYIKSAGNYIDVHTTDKTHTIRLNIGKFLENVPDQLEYVRLHRSYIVRIDKITIKSKNEVELANGMRIPVSLNHHKKLKEVHF